MANDSIVTINSITLHGNKITKDRIIYRELEFKVGNTFTVSKLDSLIVSSRSNLLNRSLFNFVTIKKNTEGNLVNIDVNVVERWYIWPIPIFQFADRNINAWIDKRNFSRLNYGLDLRVENFRGMMEELNIILQFGWDIVAGVEWKIPYLTKNQIVGMKIDAGVKLNHSIAVETFDNKEVVYNSGASYAQQNIYSHLALTLRPGFNFLHSFEVGFQKFTFQDTIFSINPDFGDENADYTYFSGSYSIKIDYRDYKPYPLKGYYFDASLSMLGFGLFDNDVNSIYIAGSFDQFIKIYKKIYFAYNLSGFVSTTHPRRPYFIKTGLGYFPYNIRGYELFVVDGQNIGIAKTNLKYEIIPPTKFKIPWLRSTKFSESFIAIYANVFFDMSYVEDIYATPQNPLANQLLYGTGVGLDFITYYDMVLRLEYAINKQNNKGFFISFVAPI